MNDVYGPGTPLIRQFLVQLAGLGAESRHGVVMRHQAIVNNAGYASAETALGVTIERAGRADAQDALAGPLLQLVRDANAPSNDAYELKALAPIAEPALAALLALLVVDLLPTAVFDELYAPFADAVPIASLRIRQRSP